MDAADRLGQGRGDRQDAQLRYPLGHRDRHRVGAHDLGDVVLALQPVQRAVREEPVGTGDADGIRLPLAQPVEELHDGAPLGDLVVQHDDVAALDVADDRADRHLVVVEALLGAGRHRYPEQPGEGRRLLGVAQVG